MKVAISGYVGNKLTGIGRVLIEMLNEIALLNTEDEYILFKNYDFEGYDVLRIHKNIKIVDIKISKNNPLGNILWHQWKFQKNQKIYNCDLAYIPNFTLLLWKRIPTIVTIHDLIEFNVPDKFSKLRMIYRKLIDPMMARNSSFITTVSECSKRDIIRFCHANQNKICVIPNATNKNRFKNYEKNAVKEYLGIYDLDYKGYYLFVGTIDYPGKNIMSALKAFVFLKKKYNIPEKMVIVGKDGFNSDVIYNFVNNTDFEKDIIFTGYVPDNNLPLIYSGAKVMIYLSYYEGFGLPVLEAMSCGIPVVCPNTSCFPEVIGNIDVGVDPNSIQEIADKLYKISKDEEFYEKISRLCYERSEDFSWEKSAKIYYEIFHSYAK